MNQNDTPLFNALIKHMDREPTSFHVPGHKYGAVFPDKASSMYENILKIDATELSGLDDLHDPEGPIYEAQQLAADYYGVEKSFFLVGGSTVGNLAAILSSCREGDVVLVQRNCHKSVMNALRLSGADPIFLHPEVEQLTGLPIGLTRDILDNALKAYPEAKALILTYPNYYGMGFPLKDMIERAHQSNLVVIVDEAHGAHLGIGHPFPESSIQADADIIIQSSHKTLPAMTMGSLLHIHGKRADYEQIGYYLRMLQSSSPSYPIMASLDLARAYVANLTRKDISEIADSIESFRQALTEIPQIEVVRPAASVLLDPLKVTIQSRTRLTGYELQSELEKHGIYTELADPYHVLLVLPLSKMEKMEQVIEKIQTALQDFTVTNKKVDINYQHDNQNKLTKLADSFKILNRMNSIKRVPLQMAEGMVSAEAVIPYPPGIPVIMDGEWITDSHIRYLQRLSHDGAKFQGTQEDLWSSGIYVYDTAQDM